MDVEAPESLEDVLAGMIARAPDAFTSGHVVLPTRDYFPEPWSPTTAGLTTLALRLHSHLGIELGAHIELDAEDESSSMLVETIIELESIDDGVARYRVSSLGRPDDAVFALLHEAARAADRWTRPKSDGPFRESAVPSSLITPDDHDEAHRDASVLAIARGLGVLVATGAHTYRQAGKTVGQMSVTEWQHAAYGGLEPLAASDLLALQLAVRKDVDHAAVLGQLPPDRATEIRETVAALTNEPVASMLDLPPEDAWPAPAQLPVPPIAQVKALTDDAPVGSAERRRKRAGRAGGVVFRVREPSPPILRSALVALVLGSVGYVVGRSLDDAFGVVLGMAGIVAGAVSVVARGRPTRATANSDCCSDPKCAKTIPPDLERCPGCGRSIVAVVYSQREATELAWAREEEEAKRLE